ncbi:hypothetical protein BH18ACI2_BH18ACI2_07570 [soil metagenome]
MGLDTVELIMAFEEEFGIAIPDKDASELATPRQVTDYVMSKLAGERITREQVAAAVRRIIEEQTDIYDFTEDSHFVRDMHLD